MPVPVVDVADPPETLGDALPVVAGDELELGEEEDEDEEAEELGDEVLELLAGEELDVEADACEEDGGLLSTGRLYVPRGNVLFLTEPLNPQLHKFFE
jgi:hypothetical protein